MTQVLTRRSVIVAVFVCATTLATAADVRAQGYIAPFVGFDFGGDSGCPEITGCEDKKLNYGIAFGALNNVGGFEQEIAYADNFFGETPGVSSSVLTVMSNFMIAPNLQVTRLPGGPGPDQDRCRALADEPPRQQQQSLRVGHRRWPDDLLRPSRRHTRRHQVLSQLPGF